MKNKGFKYITLTLILTIGLLISINLDRIKFGLSLVDQSKPPSIALENPLEKILAEEDEDDNIISIDANTGDDNIEKAPIASNSQKNNPSSNEDQISSIESTNIVQPIKENKRSITERYNGEFTSLKVKFERDLNSLIGSAYAEYKSGNSSNSQLASKYLDRGIAMEKAADSQFYSLLKSYEEELKKNSFDTSIVKDVEKYYQSFKKDRKSEIISRGMEMVEK